MDAANTFSGNAKWYHHFGTLQHFLVKFNISLPQHPPIPLLVIYSSVLEIYSNKNLHTSVYSRFIYNHCNPETSRMSSTGQWINSDTSIPKNASQ